MDFQPKEATKPRPILVTGGIRTGTTWVGKSIATAENVLYLEEPLNPDNALTYGSGIDTYFLFLETLKDKAIQDLVPSLLGLSYPLSSLFTRMKQAESNWRTQLSMLKKWAIFHILTNKGVLRSLVKDPMCFFSSAYLAEKHNFQVLYMIRHPAAYVQSCARMGWGIDIEWIRSKPGLVEKWFAPYESEIHRYANGGPTPFERSMFSWNLFHYFILQQQKLQPTQLFYRHEDLANNPLVLFPEIFSKLNLAFTEKSKAYIIASTAKENPVEAIGYNAHTLQRNSAEIPKIWKTKLSKDEIVRIRKETEEISSHFYQDSDW